MSEAAEALRHLRDLSALLERRPDVPAHSAVRGAADALERGGSPAPPPDPGVLERVREDLRRACDEGKAGSLRASDLRHAPRVLWDRDPQAASFPGLLDALLRVASERDRHLRELIEAWLRDFDPTRVKLPETGREIANLVARARDRRLDRWREAHRRYAMFDAARGPGRVGAALLAGPEEVGQVLSGTGMDDAVRADGRFFRAALREMLAAMPAAMSRPDATKAWERAAALLEERRPRRDRAGRTTSTPELRVPNTEAETIDGLLSAWSDGRAHGAAPREEVKAFLLRVIGDPRVDARPWRGAREGCATLMRGWLAAETLAAFFELISRHSNDNQWRYRQAFWRACLRKMPRERPPEVWVVLGPGLAGHARMLPALANGYGELENPGQYGDQAVLVIRLGEVVLTEWSNVGPIRAFRLGARGSPSLYARTYDTRVLRGRSMDFPDHPVWGRGGALEGKGLYHRNPENYLWQGCAAAFLKQQVGVSLSQSDYTLR